MAKSPINPTTPPSLEIWFKQAVLQVGQQISQDVDWPSTLDEAVELCLVADRPVQLGHLSEEDFEAISKMVLDYRAFELGLPVSFSTLLPAPVR
jgi:hypothetical protein